MKSKVILILSILALSGCFYQTADSHDIRRATEVCKGVENIHEISSHFTGTETVTCFDGEYTNL